MKLLLVEDEPAALAILEKMVERIPMEIEIIGKARNGLAAKEMLENHPEIDVVITDIKMPLMDGLELSEYIYQEKQDIEVVILSGFQEFSFAQKAMRFGVEDYLLKPISLKKITEVLSKIDLRQAKKRVAHEKNLLEETIKNTHTANSGWTKRYRILTLHFGSYNGLVVFDHAEIKNGIKGFENSQLFILNGRKRNEFVLILTESANLPQQIEQVQKSFVENSYMLVYSTTSFTLSQLNSTYSKMSRMIELYHRLDAQEVLNFNTMKDNLITQEDILDWSTLSKKLQDIYLKGNWADLEKRLNKAARERLDTLTTRQVLSRGNHLLVFINQYLKDEKQINPSIFEDIILSSVKLTDILHDFEQLIKHFLDQSKKLPEKIDSHEFYQLVEQFVVQNFDRFDLNLTLISTHFGISVASINDLFKKYKQQTFKEFLLHLRMTQATSKIRESSGKSLKQIAEEVGYKDALYFSKVFKKHYGKSPSSFQEEIQKLDAPSSPE